MDKKEKCELLRKGYYILSDEFKKIIAYVASDSSTYEEYKEMQNELYFAMDRIHIEYGITYADMIGFAESNNYWVLSDWNNRKRVSNNKPMDKTQEFYSYHYKEKKGGLSPEEKKRRNDLAYELAMRGKNKDAKGHALARIGVAYEDVRNYKNSKKVDMDELRYRASQFVKRMRELAASYGLTGDEVREYFARNNYSLSF